jgi:hypothetical protein
MKTKTLKQVETAKERAERFTRDVIGDDDRADEIADESLEEYADRKRIVIENPVVRNGRFVPHQQLTNEEGSTESNMATKEELEQELQGTYERIGELEATLSNIAQASQEALPEDIFGEDDEDGDDEDGDDEDDEDSRSQRMITNGLFGDGAKYIGGRVEQRQARKAYEKAVANAARANAQLEAAERRYKA